MDEIRFIESQRGGKILILNKCLFRIHKKKQNTSFWKCTHRECRVRVALTDDNHLERVSGTHTHEPDEEKVNRRTFCHNLKERSKAEKSKNVQQIYREELAKYATSPGASSYLPTCKTVEKPMYKARGEQRLTRVKKPRRKILVVLDQTLYKMEFIESSRGGKLLVLDNHLFRRNRQRQKTSHWKCSETGCPSVATVSRTNNHLLRVSGYHNHEPHDKKICRKKFYNLIKSRITQDPILSSIKIYREELAKFATTPEIKACLPSLKVAEKVMSTMRAQMSSRMDEVTQTHDKRNNSISASPTSTANESSILPTTDESSELKPTPSPTSDQSSVLGPALVPTVKESSKLKHVRRRAKVIPEACLTINVDKVLTETVPYIPPSHTDPPRISTTTPGPLGSTIATSMTCDPIPANNANSTSLNVKNEQDPLSACPGPSNISMSDVLFAATSVKQDPEVNVCEPSSNVQNSPVSSKDLHNFLNNQTSSSIYSYRTPTAWISQPQLHCFTTTNPLSDSSSVFIKEEIVSSEEEEQ